MPMLVTATDVLGRSVSAGKGVLCLHLFVEIEASDARPHQDDDCTYK